MIKQILQFLSNYPEGIGYECLVLLIEGQAGRADVLAGLIRGEMIELRAGLCFPAETGWAEVTDAVQG